MPLLFCLIQLCRKLFLFAKQGTDMNSETLSEASLLQEVVIEKSSFFFFKVKVLHRFLNFYYYCFPIWEVKQWPER